MRGHRAEAADVGKDRQLPISYRDANRITVTKSRSLRLPATASAKRRRGGEPDRGGTRQQRAKASSERARPPKSTRSAPSVRKPNREEGRAKVLVNDQRHENNVDHANSATGVPTKYLIQFLLLGGPRVAALRLRELARNRNDDLREKFVVPCRRLRR